MKLLSIFKSKDKFYHCAGKLERNLFSSYLNRSRECIGGFFRNLGFVMMFFYLTRIENDFYSRVFGNEFKWTAKIKYYKSSVFELFLDVMLVIRTRQRKISFIKKLETQFEHHNFTSLRMVRQVAIKFQMAVRKRSMKGKLCYWSCFTLYFSLQKINTGKFYFTFSSLFYLLPERLQWYELSNKYQDQYGIFGFETLPTSTCYSFFCRTSSWNRTDKSEKLTVLIIAASAAKQCLSTFLILQDLNKLWRWVCYVSSKVVSERTKEESINLRRLLVCNVFKHGPLGYA